jgi:hypothetical protein
MERYKETLGKTSTNVQLPNSVWGKLANNFGLDNSKKNRSFLSSFYKIISESGNHVSVLK